MQRDAAPFRLIGIGAGPANLGLAALARSVADSPLHITLLERRRSLGWHIDQILPGTTLQNDWSRDLVMAADPTSRFTFLNFLHQHGRLQRFLAAGIGAPSRKEISDYFHWIAAELGEVETCADCVGLAYQSDRDRFVISLADGTQREAVALSIGTGTEATLFKGARFERTDRVVYANRLARSTLCRSARRILVVGGGQSGAESVLHALSAGWDGAESRSLTWITRDSAFRALDTGHLAREFFSFGFGAQFHALPPKSRVRLNAENATAGSGISPHTLAALTRALYEASATSAGKLSSTLRPMVELAELTASPQYVEAKLRNLATCAVWTQEFDLVILCLGHRPCSRAFAARSFGLTAVELAEDYSICHPDLPPGRVFVQSDGVESHGFSDTNYVAAPFRNATILNAIVGRTVFSLNEADRFAQYSVPGGVG
jgi:lysine N6-hydroxylase